MSATYKPALIATAGVPWSNLNNAWDESDDTFSEGIITSHEVLTGSLTIGDWSPSLGITPQGFNLRVKYRFTFDMTIPRPNDMTAKIEFSIDSGGSWTTLASHTGISGQLTVIDSSAFVEVHGFNPAVVRLRASGTNNQTTSTLNNIDIKIFTMTAEADTHIGSSMMGFM